MAGLCKCWVKSWLIISVNFCYQWFYYESVRHFTYLPNLEVPSARFRVKRVTWHDKILRSWNQLNCLLLHDHAPVCRREPMVQYWSYIYSNDKFQQKDYKNLMNLSCMSHDQNCANLSLKQHHILNTAGPLKVWITEIYMIFPSWNSELQLKKSQLYHWPVSVSSDRK
jgi:hypothetical protein